MRKPPCSLASSKLLHLFDCVSKAALFDAYCQLLAAHHGHADDPATRDELVDDIVPILHMRGDRIPVDLAWEEA